VFVLYKLYIEKKKSHNFTLSSCYVDLG